MSPSKKSPKLVSPKAKKGKKGAASVFPKAKTEFVWVWNYGEGWELEELRK